MNQDHDEHTRSSASDLLSWLDDISDQASDDPVCTPRPPSALSISSEGSIGLDELIDANFTAHVGDETDLPNLADLDLDDASDSFWKLLPPLPPNLVQTNAVTMTTHRVLPPCQEALLSYNALSPTHSPDVVLPKSTISPSTTPTTITTTQTPSPFIPISPRPQPSQSRSLTSSGTAGCQRRTPMLRPGSSPKALRQRASHIPAPPRRGSRPGSEAPIHLMPSISTSPSDLRRKSHIPNFHRPTMAPSASTLTAAVAALPSSLRQPRSTGTHRPPSLSFLPHSGKGSHPPNTFKMGSCQIARF